MAWHWCENVAVFQSIERYWHQLVLLAPIVSFAVDDSIHLDLILLWPGNWECELMEGCVQIISHVVTGQCLYVLLSDICIVTVVNVVPSLPPIEQMYVKGLALIDSSSPPTHLPAGDMGLYEIW